MCTYRFHFKQIVDGNSKTDVSNRRDPGLFCGEAEQPQTFISETSYVKVVFHTDNFTDQVMLKLLQPLTMAWCFISNLHLLLALKCYQSEQLLKGLNNLVKLSSRVPSIFVDLHRFQLNLFLPHRKLFSSHFSCRLILRLTRELKLRSIYDMDNIPNFIQIGVARSFKGKNHNFIIYIHTKVAVSRGERSQVREHDEKNN